MEVNNDTIFFLGLVHLICSRSMTFQKPAMFALSGKEAPNEVEPFDFVILNHLAP